MDPHRNPHSAFDTFSSRGGWSYHLICTAAAPSPFPPGAVIIPSYLGRGGSPSPPPPPSQDIPSPLPLHTQWLKTYAREHPLPTYTMAKNAGLPGVCQGIGGGSLGPGIRGSASANAPAISGAWTYVREVSSARPQGRPTPLAAPGLMLLNGHRRCPFEEKRRICYASDSMVEYNRCDWLIIERA